MTGKRFVFSIIFCLVQINLFAKAIIDIGAVVETESHLFTLKTIERYNDSLSVNWEIKSKKSNTKVKINIEEISLLDYYTNIKHKPIHSLSKTRIEIVDAFDTDTLRIIFPAIKDTTSLISVHLSSKIMVDSILLPSSNMSLIGEVRYKIPFCDKILKDRRDSVFYSDSLFSSGMLLYNKRQYHDAIVCFEKCYAFDTLVSTKNGRV